MQRQVGLKEVIPMPSSKPMKQILWVACGEYQATFACDSSE